MFVDSFSEGLSGEVSSNFWGTSSCAARKGNRRMKSNLCYEIILFGVKEIIILDFIIILLLTVVHINWLRYISLTRKIRS